MMAKVGIGVICWQDGQVLLGLRQGSHAAGVWACPGGALDDDEMVFEGAAREVYEETQLQTYNMRKVPVWSDDIFEGGKHFVCVFCACDVEGEPVLVEPNKCAEWRWFDPHDLPDNLMVGTAEAIYIAAQHAQSSFLSRIATRVRQILHI